MPDYFMQSLEIMWKGMFTIFSVIIVITLIVIAFQWLEKKLSKNKNVKE